MSEFSKNAKKIGTNIKNCRLKLNITQKELADKAGVSDAWIRIIERGECIPSRTHIKAISTALRTTPETITEVSADELNAELDKLDRLRKARGKAEEREKVSNKELADFRKAVKSKEDPKSGILLMPDCQRHCAICGKPIENTEGIKREGRDLNNYRIDYEALHCSHCGTFIGFKFKLSNRKALNYFKSIVKWAIKNT